MQLPVPPVTWLTPESHRRLQGELDVLMDARGGQEESTERVAIETRVRQLVALLRNVRVHSPEDDGIVEPGMLVEALIDGRTESFLMGSREIFGDDDLDVFSEKSPLGVAIYGKKPGDEATYVAPSGRPISVTVISATPYAGPGSHPAHLATGTLDTAS
ncbi:GreA/GreB family elongation factor [Arthrobacter sp. H41]|uniref:GreA/GreB family elongation factor n=1 Tax=Arthrobacter sp. H41 TaxID=1312978 RepID=UPI0006762EBF|nr:GreA/GreB family elongation factor [Arthrobacter sp. H41]